MSLGVIPTTLIYIILTIATIVTVLAGILFSLILLQNLIYIASDMLETYIRKKGWKGLFTKVHELK